MTELETLQRAKTYLDKLANGIDPLTNTPVPDGECINQIRISRCLFYVSDVLRKLIDNGGIVEKSKKIKKTAFSITEEELKGYIIDSNPIPVSEIVKRINNLIDSDTRTKLKHSNITAFLIVKGLLYEQEVAEGKTVKVPTDLGKSLGILREERQGRNGSYYVNVYNATAQQFILDNIGAIAEIDNPQKHYADLNGQPWTSNYDETLVDLYKKQVPLAEIAVTLKRTESAVRARLRKLEIIQ